MQQLHNNVKGLSGVALGEVFFKIGVVHINQGDLDSAHHFFMLSKQKAEQGADIRLLYRSYTNLGLVRHRQDDYGGAIQLYLAALKISEQYHFDSGTARLLVNLGEVRLHTGDTVKGLEMLHKAEQLLFKMKDSVPLSALYSIMADCYYNMEGLLDKADWCAGQTLSMCQVLLARSNLSVLEKSALLLYNRSAYLNKSNIFTKRGQYDQAMEVLEQFRRQYFVMTAPPERLIFYAQIANIALKQDRYAAAFRYSDSAIATSYHQYVPRLASIAYELRAQAYQFLGNYKAALDDSRRMFEIRDSLSYRESKSRSAELQAKYDLGKKDARIEELRKTNQLKTVLTVVAIGAALVAMFAFLMTNRSRRLEKKVYAQKNSLLLNEKELEQNRLQVRLMEVEQMALRAQMNPHFIFNSLNSIQYYVINRDLAGANKYISMLGSLIRLTLDYTAKQRIALANELKYLANYMELEKMRMQDKFEYEIHHATDIDPEEVQIPPMLLQPIVENAIRHGIRHLANVKGLVQITIDRVADGIRYTVVDNGVGREASARFKNPLTSRHQSKGLDLLRSRLALLHGVGAYPSVTIEDLQDDTGSPQGTKVVIVVPG